MLKALSRVKAGQGNYAFLLKIGTRMRLIFRIGTDGNAGMGRDGV